MNPFDGPPPLQSASTVPPKVAVIVPYSRRRHIFGCAKPPPPPITSVFSRKRKRPISVLDSTIPRRTRDLPNISECHACGFRIDLSSGKDRLRALYSEWRVVLLCKKCISRVESSAVCSYCFAEVSEGFRCSGCNRRIHESCYLDYKSTAPWSYSSSGSQFSVCIDCWVPKSLARHRPLKQKRSAKQGREVVCALRCDRVMEVGDTAKPLQSVEKDTSSLRDSKNEGCTRSSVKVVKENVMLVSDCLGGQRNEMSARDCKEMVVDNVVDDAELAFQLHRSINSSRRISKKLRVDKMSSMVYNRRMKKCAGNALVRASESEKASTSGSIQVCINEGSHDNLDKSNSENFMASCHVCSVNVHFSEANRVVDQRSSWKDTAYLVKCNEEEGNLLVTMKEGEGSSLNGMGTEFQTCSKDDDSVKLMDVGNVGKKDRNLLTYCKKSTGLLFLGASACIVSSYKIILEVERYYTQRLRLIHCIQTRRLPDLRSSAVEMCLRLISVDAGALSTGQLILGNQVDEGAVSHSWSLQNGLSRFACIVLIEVHFLRAQSCLRPCLEPGVRCAYICRPKPCA